MSCASYENTLQNYEKFSISNTFYSYFNKKSSELFVDSRKKHYLCNDKSRPLPIRTAYPAGHFLYIDMRYTKQAMTLTQQILSEAPTHTV